MVIPRGLLNNKYHAKIKALASGGLVLTSFENVADILGCEKRTLMMEINRIVETSKRSMGKPSCENLKLDELIRDAIALLIQRGEIKIPRKKTATLVARRETRTSDLAVRLVWHGLKVGKAFRAFKEIYLEVVDQPIDHLESQEAGDSSARSHQSDSRNPRPSDPLAF